MVGRRTIVAFAWCLGLKARFMQKFQPRAAGKQATMMVIFLDPQSTLMPNEQQHDQLEMRVGWIGVVRVRHESDVQLLIRLVIVLNRMIPERFPQVGRRDDEQAAALEMRGGGVEGRTQVVVAGHVVDRVMSEHHVAAAAKTHAAHVADMGFNVGIEPATMIQHRFGTVDGDQIEVVAEVAQRVPGTGPQLQNAAPFLVSTNVLIDHLTDLFCLGEAIVRRAQQRPKIGQVVVEAGVVTDER